MPFSRALQHGDLAAFRIKQKRCRQTDGHGLALEALEGGKGAVGIKRQVGELALVEKGLRLFEAARAEVEARVKAALAEAGYPAKADPARLNFALCFAILMIFMTAACAVYGPQAAALVELFPTRVRYTAMSLPYNIGTGWVGGLLPAASFALVAASGNIYFGLWYAVGFTLIAAIVSLIWLPETKGRDLDAIP